MLNSYNCVLEGAYKCSPIFHFTLKGSKLPYEHAKVFLALGFTFVILKEAYTSSDCEDRKIDLRLTE